MTTTETDVLRETVTRVESLAENIGSLTAQIRSNVAEAMHNLGPLAQRVQGSTDARQGIDGIVGDLEQLRPLAVELKTHDATITSGLYVEGPQKYGEAWTALGSIYTRLTTDFKQFHGLIKQVTNLQQQAEQDSQAILHDELSRIFAEQDPHPDDVSSLSQLLPFLESHNMGSQIHVMATTQVRIATTKAVQAHAQRIETPAAIKKFRSFHQQYLAQQAELLQHLFPRHAEEYLELEDEIFKVEEQQLTKKVGRLSQGKQKGDMGAFDEIETVVELDPQDTEVPRLLGVGSDRIRSLYATVDGLLDSKAPEVGISAAVEKCARIIRDLAKHEAAVRLSLQEQAPRFYLPHQQSPGWLRGFPITSKLPDLLDLFVADLLENVFFSLEQTMSKSGKPPAQQGLYLINNTSFVQHFLASNGGLLVSKGVAETRLQKHHNNAIKLYLAEWQRLSQCLMDPTLTRPNAKLTGKEREAVKERFRQFNTEFEVLVDKQRKASIPDKDLRMELSRAIGGIIRPLYQLFYDKHSSGDFTKNLDKYVKYDPKKLESILATM